MPSLTPYADAMRRAHRQRPTPSNHGAPWNTIEEDALLAEFRRGARVDEIASSHGRTVGAINARLALLLGIRYPDTPNAYRRRGEPIRRRGERRAMPRTTLPDSPPRTPADWPPFTHVVRRWVNRGDPTPPTPDLNIGPHEVTLDGVQYQASPAPPPAVESSGPASGVPAVTGESGTLRPGWRYEWSWEPVPANPVPAADVSEGVTLVEPAAAPMEWIDVRSYHSSPVVPSPEERDRFVEVTQRAADQARERIFRPARLRRGQTSGEVAEPVPEVPPHLDYKPAEYDLATVSAAILAARPATRHGRAAAAQHSALNKVAHNFANLFAGAAGEAFDRAKWLEACGVTIGEDHGIEPAA